MAVLDVEGFEHLAEKGRESYKTLLDTVVNDYRAMEVRRQEARERWRQVRDEGWSGRQGEEGKLRYYAAEERYHEAEFGTDWELRLHRNACEQLRSEIKKEIQHVRRSLDRLEKEAGELGERAKNSLPRPNSEVSTQQSSKVRGEASRLLSSLRRGFHA